MVPRGSPRETAGAWRTGYDRERRGALPQLPSGGAPRRRFAEVGAGLVREGRTDPAALEFIRTLIPHEAFLRAVGDRGILAGQERAEGGGRIGDVGESIEAVKLLFIALDLSYIVAGNQGVPC